MWTEVTNYRRLDQACSKLRNMKKDFVPFWKLGHTFYRNLDSDSCRYHCTYLPTCGFFPSIGWCG